MLRDSESVHQILEFVPTIDFTTTVEVNEDISLFETNIRYLGGLISGYDLLKGPYADLVDDAKLVDNLLAQAVSLADTLSFAFDTPSGIPDPVLVLNPEPRRNGSTSNNIAECGTLVLEWTRLSDLTGDDKYAKLAQKAQDYLISPNKEGEPFPGLTGTFVSIEDGKFIDAKGGWGGYTDSFYEYLIKMYLYDPVAFESYKDRWIKAADSTMEYLTSHPTTREDLTFLTQYQGQQVIPSSSHLASFAGGNFFLGGILLGEQKYTDYALNVTNSYFEPYRQTAAGIGPEGFRWVASEIPEDGEFNKPPAEEDAAFYEKAGFWASSPQYILRPETMESIYYAYRVTGDKKWQDMAWTAFQSIESQCKIDISYAGLNDVTVDASEGGHIDKMESFWITETLKYIWLIFADEDVPVHIHADKPMTWVFNTEAHPVQIRGQ